VHQWVVIEVEEAYIHCAKHIPRLAKVPREIHWGTDDMRRKGGDFFGVAADRRAREGGGAGEAGQAREQDTAAGSIVEPTPESESVGAGEVPAAESAESSASVPVTGTTTDATSAALATATATEAAVETVETTAEIATAEPTVETDTAAAERGLLGRIGRRLHRSSTP
jgi:hypothetical protein